MSLQFTVVRVAASLSVCTCLSLVGCGQKGNLYLPTTNPSNSGVIEHKNTNSHFILGSSEKVKPITSAQQSVTGGSAS